MDPFFATMLTNEDKCVKTDTRENKERETYSDIINMIRKIDNKEMLKNISKISLERCCCKELTPNQINIIITAIKKIE